MESSNNNLNKDDVIQLIYGSEDNILARKVLSIFLQQQKDTWLLESNTNRVKANTTESK